MNESPSPALTSHAADALSRLLPLACIEDGVEHDLTCELLERSCGPLPPANGQLLVRQAGILCGISCAHEALVTGVDPEIAAGLSLATHASDGDEVVPGQVILEVRGAAALLHARERLLLNLIGHLSGIATATGALVEAVAGTSCQVLHTRKTMPGLRDLELHAVRCGGGSLHRRSLDDGVLLKENHFASVPAASYEEVLEQVIRAAPDDLPVMVEAEFLEQARAAARLGAAVVLLDDFETALLPAVVAEVRAVGRPPGRSPIIIEVSGGVSLSTAAGIAASGCDRISSGAITHSAPQLDLSFLIERAPA